MTIHFKISRSFEWTKQLVRTQEVLQNNRIADTALRTTDVTKSFCFSKSIHIKLRVVNIASCYLFNIASCYLLNIASCYLLLISTNHKHSYLIFNIIGAFGVFLMSEVCLLRFLKQFVWNGNFDLNWICKVLTTELHAKHRVTRLIHSFNR